jgi:hypothetical protein
MKIEETVATKSKEREELETLVRAEVSACVPKLIPELLKNLEIKGRPLTNGEKAKRVGTFLLGAVVAGAIGGSIALRRENKRKRKMEAVEHTKEEAALSAPNGHSSRSRSVSASA